MIPQRATLAGAVLGLVFAESSPWWATTVITETVWTVCEAEPETTPIGPADDCPPSTSIVLENAVLTGITVQPVSSPTSCYRLPTPTSSLEGIAFAPYQTPGSTPDDLVFFYLGENATVPEYIATIIDGERCMLDVSSNASAAGRVALMLAGGESLVFDETGLHHFAAGCNSASSLEISNFVDQVASIVESSVCSDKRGNPLTAELKQRDEGKNFTVKLQVEKEIHGRLKQPHLDYSSSPCSLVEETVNEMWGNFTFTCRYPGANSDQQACQDALSTWLQPTIPVLSESSTTRFHVSPNHNKLMANLPQFLDRAAAPLANLIPNISAPLQQGMAWIKTAQLAAIDLAQFGGSTLCNLLHVGTLYNLVFTDPALPTAHTVGVYHSPPVETILGTLATHTTRATTYPPRQVVPSVTELTSVTATTFSAPPIFW
ncbi:hypothetical protein QBC34DRAFT_187868 [Podospora aff. communis PSN243]|uniref:Uncharacterized protein n=1 Tax=Podospora aff. communis PSN243 TaxID=3040156 RepID=A0AAV9GAI3_9PEZI|nr:hypothetical protein QBC34DRAFT_187868 [Podospora aff. communis PSN243]